MLGKFLNYRRAFHIRVHTYIDVYGNFITKSIRNLSSKETICCPRRRQRKVIVNKKPHIYFQKHLRLWKYISRGINHDMKRLLPLTRRVARFTTTGSIIFGGRFCDWVQEVACVERWYEKEKQKQRCCGYQQPCLSVQKAQT